MNKITSATTLAAAAVAFVPPVKEPVEKIDNTELVENFRLMGGRILHCRANAFQRGVTFAYRVKGRRVEIATAVQHTNDTFTKKVGTKTAIGHFHAGKTITLPTTPGGNILEALNTLRVYL